ncbi:hypothetical protein L3X38_018557 [Prunus dulcis]|uniref:Wall-associated receptor kinase C-terminal domain-containing protein n=1 Tax=Prunus dulcis TaxID=3755 RepID=A0AAD4W995_PRUDU|nr:hypothetical protein L3X38_018557 [Prunus dulcis]
MLLRAETPMIPTNLPVHYYSTPKSGPTELNYIIIAISLITKLHNFSHRRPKCFLRLSYPFETLLGSDPRTQTQAHSSGCWNKKTPTGVKCKIETTVLILKTAAAKLGANRSLFQEAIMEGFNVNYTNPYDNECSKWLDVKSCGFDSDSSRPVCFCGDRVCDILGILAGVTSAIVFIVCMVHA